MDFTKAKDYTTMAQQMTGVYKRTIDNSINAMTMIQESTEKIVNLSLAQAPGFRRRQEVRGCLDEGLQEGV